MAPPFAPLPTSPAPLVAAAAEPGGEEDDSGLFEAESVRPFPLRLAVGTRREGAVYAGIGVVGGQGVSPIPPIDLLLLVVGAEQVRRRINAASFRFLVADTHACEAGHDPEAVQAAARYRCALLRAGAALLHLPACEVMLGSTLERHPAYSAPLARARLAAARTGAYFAREAADIEFMRLHEGALAKVGWALPQRSGPSARDERAFDAVWREAFGGDDPPREGPPALDFWYVEAGRTLDPQRPHVAPYLAPVPTRQILLRPDEEVAAKLDACTHAKSRRRMEERLSLLRRHWEALNGMPLPGRDLAGCVQSLIEQLCAAAAAGDHHRPFPAELTA